jgi:hypothetical protein
VTDPALDLPPRIIGTGPRGSVTAKDLAAARMAAGGPAGRPPVTLEPLGFPFGSRGGPTLLVDRYSLNPLLDYLRQLPAADGMGAGEPPPKMFANGTRDLPILTASGVDPQKLVWLPWFARYAAAAGDATSLYVMLEDSAELDISEIKSRHSSTQWTSYLSRMWRWATAVKKPDQMTSAEYTEFAVSLGWLPADTEE